MEFSKSYLENIECVNDDCFVYSVDRLCPPNSECITNRLKDKCVQCGLVKHNYKNRPMKYEGPEIIEDDDYDYYEESSDDEEYDVSKLNKMFDHFFESLEKKKQFEDKRKTRCKTKHPKIEIKNSTKKNRQ